MVSVVPDHESIWELAVQTTNVFRNIMYSASENFPNKKPYDAGIEIKSDSSMPRVFGSKIFLHLPKH